MQSSVANQNNLISIPFNLPNTNVEAPEIENNNIINPNGGNILKDAAPEILPMLVGGARSKSMSPIEIEILTESKNDVN